MRSSCAFFYHSVKATFDFLDTPTAPDVLQSRCIHKCHTNRLIIRLPLLTICVNRLFTTQRTVKSVDFLKCLDNDVINMYCSRLPLFICVSNIHVK